MIEAFKDLLKRHWPALRLREILFAVLLFAAAMPTVEALYLRGYENALVRQGEAELTAQGAALAAATAALWPGSAGPAPAPNAAPRPEPPAINLGSDPVLPDRPPPAPSSRPVDPDALAAAQRLAGVVDQTTQTTQADIVMLDRTGLVALGPDGGGDLSALPEVRAALAGQSRTVLRRDSAYRSRYIFEWLSRASSIRLHQARPILVDGRIKGVLLLSRSPRSLFRGVYQGLGRIALAAGVIIAILLFLAGLVSRGVTRPIEALSRATRAVAAGRGEAPEAPATAAVEIRDLYQDFARMAQVIAHRSRYLRDFAAAVSHEFKTPLAGISGAAELLQDHYETMSAAERGVFLANIAADSARLSHLVARLLDMARADMARPDADARTPLAGAARRVADALSQNGFGVTLDLPAELPPLAIPETTLETVLATLIENSRQAGAGQLNLSARATGEAVAITLADDGSGFSPADRERLFEPFFTTRRAQGGTGLGLSIARSLVEAHGGELILLDPPSGATFSLTLPSA